MRSYSPSVSLLLFIVLAVGVMSGCRSTRPAAMPVDDSGSAFPDHSPSEILALMGGNMPDVPAYTAESALAIRLPSQSGSFSAAITHRRDDSLYMTISPGMGIEAVRALVTPDSFFVHDRINKELSYGSIRYLRKMLPFPASSDTLYAAMLGLVTPEAQVDWTLTTMQSYYVFTAPDSKRIYTVDPTYWRVVRYEERTSFGDLLEERTYSEFENYDGQWIPRRLTFRRPKDDTAATLYYRRLNLNPGTLSFSFHVDDRVDRIPIGR